MSNSLKLELYNGKMLTKPEMLLIKLYEAHAAEMKKEADEKIFARKLLSSGVRQLMEKQASSIPAKDVEPTSAPTSAANAPIKKIASSETLQPNPPPQKQVSKPPPAKRTKFEEEPSDILPPLSSDEDEQEDDKQTVESDVEESFENLKPLQRQDSNQYQEPPTPRERKPTAAPAADATEQPAVPTAPIKKIGKRALVAPVEEDEENEENNDPNTIFSLPGLLFNGEWSSKQSTATDLAFLLPDFSCNDHKQTLALQMSLPPHSDGWALNITPEKDVGMTDIFLHFNPRYNKGMIMMTDRQGTWGQPIKKSIGNDSKVDTILSKHLEIVVQVQEHGFGVFANNVFCAYFMHRRDLFKNAASLLVGNLIENSSGSSGSSSSGGGGIHALKVIVPARDGNGKPEEIIVHKVWWGHTDHSNLRMPSYITENIVKNAAEIAAQAAATAAAIAQRTVTVSGILVTDNLVELQAIEFALFDMFEEFEPETISVPPGTGLAFARLTSPDMVAGAIAALNGIIMGSKEDAGGEFTLTLSPMQQ